MSQFICTNCNYRFASERVQPPKKCPYCSEIGTVKAEPSAEKLLEEVDSLIKDGKI
jgi:DNA-directed RNA polymerase subunit RPC12/RpoP